MASLNSDVTTSMRLLSKSLFQVTFRMESSAKEEVKQAGRSGIEVPGVANVARSATRQLIPVKAELPREKSDVEEVTDAAVRA